MAYSMAGIIAFFVTIIVNIDIFMKPSGQKDLIPGRNIYRIFLLSTLLYYLADGIWGILNLNHLKIALYIDTYVYFVAMGLVVFMWARYIVEYLKEKNHFTNLLVIFSWMFLTAHLILLVINLIVPIFFHFDDAAAYQIDMGRNISLIVQAFIFLGTALYTFYFMIKNHEDERKPRYLAIALCSSALTILTIFQYFYPLQPLYSLAFLAGTCLLHTFVVEAGKKSYRRELESLIAADKKHREELEYAQLLAMTDPLTGVKSKHAYIEVETMFDARIGYGNQREFSLVVFDLNDLKTINDTYGHDKGDEYIKSAVTIIKGIYKYSDIFRVGGDEFAVILEGEDFTNREVLIKKFNDIIDKNVVNGGPVIAAGMADFLKYKDNSITHLFIRADRLMYERKAELKKAQGIDKPNSNPHD